MQDGNAMKRHIRVWEQGRGEVEPVANLDNMTKSGFDFTGVESCNLLLTEMSFRGLSYGMHHFKRKSSI